jgi:hypothetical protein
MKWFVFMSLMALSAFSDTCAAEDTFSKSVLPEDYSALGLSKLSAEELSRLDAKIDAYKSGALTAARRAADEALAAKQTAEAKSARAEAEAKAAKSAAEKSRQVEQSHVAQSNKVIRPAARGDEPTIESTLPGKFRGWVGHQVLVLANGQRWQISNDESYYSPAAENLKVRITRAAVTGYWLTIPALDARVRVVPVEAK